MIISIVCQNWVFLASKFVCDILFFQMYILVMMLSSELKEFSTLAPNWFQSCDCCTWQLSTLDDLLQFTFIFFFSFTFTSFNFCLTNLIFTFTLTCQQLSIHDVFLQFTFEASLLSLPTLNTVFEIHLHSLHLFVTFFGFIYLLTWQFPPFLMISSCSPSLFSLPALCPLFVIDFFHLYVLHFWCHCLIYPLLNYYNLPCYPLLNSLLQFAMHSVFDHQWKEQNYRRGLKESVAFTAESERKGMKPI